MERTDVTMLNQALLFLNDSCDQTVITTAVYTKKDDEQLCTQRSVFMADWM